MATTERDRQHPTQVQVHTQSPLQHPYFDQSAGKGQYQGPYAGQGQGQYPGHYQGQGKYQGQGQSESGPSTSQVLAVLTLLPVGGSLLALSGLILVATVIGLMVATPLFLLFSPVLVPAAIVIGLAVTGFAVSGAFGLTGLSSLSWVLNWIRRAIGTDQLDEAKYLMQDAVGYVGQKTKETGQAIQSKAYEGGKGHEVGARTTHEDKRT